MIAEAGNLREPFTGECISGGADCREAVGDSVFAFSAPGATTALLSLLTWILARLCVGRYTRQCLARL